MASKRKQRRASERSGRQEDGRLERTSSDIYTSQDPPKERRHKGGQPQESIQYGQPEEEAIAHNGNDTPMRQPLMCNFSVFALHCGESEPG